MYNVIVLAGGDSPEREVSLRSGQAVCEALQAGGHHVIQVDPAGGLASRHGELKDADVIFPVLHGAGGEDGTVQALLESWNLPYVGSDVASSQLCFDKGRYKDFIGRHNVRLPAGGLVDIQGFNTSPLRKQPFVLKPHDGGSSVDTYIVRDPDQFDAATAFQKHRRMLLEQLVDGVEVTVGVLDDSALPVIEIIPPAGGDFDYTNKYNGSTQELCPPQHVSADQQTAVQDIALTAHRLCGCRHLSRSDLIISRSGEPYLLETNTMPGMTAQSLYPKMAATAGITMSALCQKLLEMAVVKKT